MRSLLLLFALFSLGSAMGQGTWKVTLNGKTLLNASVENTDKNIIMVSSADLKKKGDFIITYTEKTKVDKWQRTISAYNEKDIELQKQTGNRFKIKNSTLQSLLKGAKTIQFYTISLPTDPKLQAAVRVRRVHLCTVVGKK